MLNINDVINEAPLTFSKMKNEKDAYLAERQWRLELDHVDVRPVGLHQYLLGPESFENEICLLAIRSSDQSVRHQFESHEHSGAANISDCL